MGNDPSLTCVVDYVGGKADLEAKVVRCIGDPNKRFTEDALRMLRAARFVSQLGFTIEQKTFDAIVANSHRMVNVSRERVAEELFKLVTGKFAVQGLMVLATTGLFAQVFGREFVSAHATATTLERFAKFPTSNPLKGLAMLMTDTSFDFSLVAVQSLKLSSDRQVEVMGAVVHKMGTLTAVEDADVVRLAREPGMKLAVDLFEQELAMGMHTTFGVEFGMSQVFRFRELAPEDVTPVPMVMGRDLLAMGFKPSKLFSQVLFAVETKQLNGEFADAAEALEFARTEMEKA
jgi:tRNA nucleotidyltransferase/poly(A) polymerase